MSNIEPLDPDILEGEGIEADSGLWILLRRLNRATDRTNSQDERIRRLEAENKELRHLWNQNETWLTELKVAYEGHTHEFTSPDSDQILNWEQSTTTPPTNNGTRGASNT